MGQQLLPSLEMQGGGVRAGGEPPAANRKPPAWSQSARAKARVHEESQRHWPHRQPTHNRVAAGGCCSLGLAVAPQAVFLAQAPHLSLPASLSVSSVQSVSAGELALGRSAAKAKR
jgi:hypothetical protein